MAVDWTKYTFNDSWFQQHEPAWDAELAPWLAARAAFGVKIGHGLRTLEIGCYEGLSTIWTILQCAAIVERLASTYVHVCIDPWPGPEYKPIRDRCLENIRRTGLRYVVVHEEPSLRALPRYNDKSFDFIYVDGSHKAADVYDDTLQALRLVRPGGLVLWDDYACSSTPGEELAAVRAGVGQALKTVGIKAETLPLLGQHLRYNAP